MKIKEMVIKELDSMNLEEILLLSEQIKLLKKTKKNSEKIVSIEEIQKNASSSSSCWSDDIIRDRETRE